MGTEVDAILEIILMGEVNGKIDTKVDREESGACITRVFRKYAINMGSRGMGVKRGESCSLSTAAPIAANKAL